MSIINNCTKFQTVIFALSLNWDEKYLFDEDYYKEKTQKNTIRTETFWNRMSLFNIEQYDAFQLSRFPSRCSANLNAMSLLDMWTRIYLISDPE
jgi:hypothetical protein